MTSEELHAQSEVGRTHEQRKEKTNERTDICPHKTAVIICYTHVTSDRIWLEVMSRWIHNQPMKSLLAILIPHHKSKALLMGWFFSINIHHDMTSFQILPDVRESVVYKTVDYQIGYTEIIITCKHISPLERILLFMYMFHHDIPKIFRHDAYLFTGVHREIQSWPLIIFISYLQT